VSDNKEYQTCEMCKVLFLRGVRSRRFCIQCSAKRSYTPVQNAPKNCGVCNEMFKPSNKSEKFCGQICKAAHKIQQTNSAWCKEYKPKKVYRQFGHMFKLGSNKSG